MSEPSFAEALSALCANELVVARRDSDRMGVMIERLINSLALTIATACRGNPDGMDEMLQGAEGYLFRAAADHLRLVRLLEGR